jgi:hypothetical protein
MRCKLKCLNRNLGFINGSVILAMAIYSINIFFAPLKHSMYDLANDINNPKIQQAMGAEDYIHSFSGQGEEAALKYLRLAHAVTMKYIDYKEAVSDEFSDNVLLDKRIGDCTETAAFTYSNFLFLTSASGKGYLAEYIREASGIRFAGGNEVDPHVWLEIKLNGAWLPYETTENDLAPSTEFTPESVQAMPDALALKNFSYHRTNTFQINDKGFPANRIDFIGTATNYRGLAFLLYKQWKNRSR